MLQGLLKGVSTGAVGLTWDPATVTAVTLSGGNLTAANTGTTSTNQGAHVPSTLGKSSGKYYFELTYSVSKTGVNVGFGVGTTVSTYVGMGNNATTGAMAFFGTGPIYANGVTTGKSIGARVAADVIGMAVDLDNLMIWFKVIAGSGAPGDWNGTVAADPATDTGGLAIPAGTYVPFCTFGGTAGQAGTTFVANFGASAFIGSVPSGFTSGWSL